MQKKLISLAAMLASIAELTDKQSQFDALKGSVESLAEIAANSAPVDTTEISTELAAVKTENVKTKSYILALFDRLDAVEAALSEPVKTVPDTAAAIDPAVVEAAVIEPEVVEVVEAAAIDPAVVEAAQG